MIPEPGPFGSSAALSISKDPPRGSHEDMLLVACMVGNPKAVLVLAQGPVKNPGFGNQTPLLVASRLGHGECVRNLLAANPSAVDPTARSCLALRVACRAGHAEVVDALLDDGRVDPSLLNSEALRAACWAPLDNAGSDVARAVLAHPSLDFTCEVLLRAVEMTNAEAVRILLAREDSAQALETARPFLFRSLIRGAAPKIKRDYVEWSRKPFSDMVRDRAAVNSPDPNSDARVVPEECGAKAPGEPVVDTHSVQTTGGFAQPSDAENVWREETLKTMKILLADDRINPNANFDYLFRFSVFYDRTYLVEALLNDPRIDPRIGNYEAIRLVQSLDMAKLLANDERVDRKHPAVESGLRWL
ncbi:hypothetical protein HDU96_002422 [Phlyctochytrium bullatum]|nr:hypothetical protein HDU96_002422 [Phlyctochytrium bullatum]